MALGALPRPGRGPEQRLFVPRISLRWRRHCGTFRGWRLVDLGFLHREASYRRRGKVGGRPGGPHHLVAWPGLARAQGWCGDPMAPLRLVFWLRESSGKISTLAFVRTNSEDIDFLTFLEPKTAENRQLALWHLVNRLVQEII